VPVRSFVYASQEDSKCTNGKFYVYHWEVLNARQEGTKCQLGRFLMYQWKVLGVPIGGSKCAFIALRLAI